METELWVWSVAPVSQSWHEVVPAACFGSVAGRQCELVIELQVAVPFDLSVVVETVLGAEENVVLYVVVGSVAELLRLDQLRPLVVRVTWPELVVLVLFALAVLGFQRGVHSHPVL